MSLSFTTRAARWLAACALAGMALVAHAQTEPTIQQIYSQAQAGHLTEAQSMVEQVLKAHPGSGKAHFVAAEIAARQGQYTHARESLAQAETLAPGLPFARPEAVQSLRAQLAPRTGNTSAAGSGSLGLSVPHLPGATDGAARVAAGPASGSGFPWAWVLALGAGVLGLGFFMARRNPPAPVAAPPYGGGYAMAGAGGLNGPQTFGTGQGAPGYPVYGPAPAASGLGGRLAGGLATGLAVGAGVMAAETIGRSLLGGGGNAARPAEPAPAGGYVPFEDAPAANRDMGGQDFGVNDPSTWDDGGGAGGGDWDT